MRTVCLSASVPALGRTRHPFAVSDSEEPSQKIEFVFSASPETIRREPLECDLLRSVAHLQDLAVCARKDLDVFPFLGRVFRLPRCEGTARQARSPAGRARPPASSTRFSWPWPAWPG